MKKYMVGILVLGLSAQAGAGILDVGIKALQKAKVYGEDTQIGFELYDKLDRTVWFALRNGNKIFKTDTGSYVFAVKPGSKIAQEIDINKDTALALWLADPGLPFISLNKSKPGGIAWGAAEPSFVFTFPQGKTLYLTLGESPKGPILREQTGPVGGKLGKTDSGFSLEKPGNVKQAEIETVFEKQFTPVKI